MSGKFWEGFWTLLGKLLGDFWIVLGGLGWRVTSDLWSNRYTFDRRRLSLHTRLVLRTSFFLILIGTCGLFITESLITIITDNNTSIYVDPNMPIANINKLKEFEKSIKHLKNIDDHQYINLIYEKQIVVKERDSFNHG